MYTHFMNETREIEYIIVLPKDKFLSCKKKCKCQY